MSLKISEEFLKDYSGLIHAYNDRFLADESLSDMEVAILAIHLIESYNHKCGAKYDEVKDIFISFGRKSENFKVAVYNAKKQNLIEHKEASLFLIIKGLSSIQKILGQIEKSSVHIIKSGQNFTAIKLFEEFLLNEIKGSEVLLCDSYISPASLFPFSSLNGKLKSIRILTSNIFDSDKLKDYINRMKKEMGITVEVKTNRKIHDRFLISKDSCWSFGTSLKDLGNKDTVLKEINEVFDSMKVLFEERWNE